MRKYGNYRRETVRDTVRMALTPVKPQKEYVSHRSLGRALGDAEINNSAFSSENHAIYLGKIKRAGKDSLVKRAFGLNGDYEGQSEGNIYSEELIAACLDYAFKHAEKGKKIRVYVARVFSEMINGKKDADLAMPVEEEMEFIYDIAKKMGKKKDELEVLNLELSSRHTEIFEALKGSYDDKKARSDTAKAFGGGEGCVNLDESCSSLDIARLIYGALGKNELLRQRLQVTVPGNLDGEGEDLPQEEVMHLSCYAVSEIAIRIREILIGSYIHEGVDRQVVYDDLINELINNDKSARKNYPELEPLFRLLKGRKFETVHVTNNPEKNHFFRLAERVRARTRLLTYGVMAAAGLTGVFGGTTGIVVGCGAIREAKREAMINEEISAEIESCRDVYGNMVEGNWCIDYFTRMTDSVVGKIKIRYGIDREKEPEIQQMVQAFLLDHKEYLSMDTDLRDNLIDLIADLTVKENRLYLKSRGYKADRPFQYLPFYGKE